MSQGTIQSNSRSITAANEELLLLMRRIAMASERTSRRVLVIELFFLIPFTFAIVAGIMFLAGFR